MALSLRKTGVFNLKIQFKSYFKTEIKTIYLSWQKLLALT